MNKTRLLFYKLFYTKICDLFLYKLKQYAKIIMSTFIVQMRYTNNTR